MQVDCIYNQEEAVDVTGAPAADLLSDMKKRYLTIPLPMSDVSISFHNTRQRLPRLWSGVNSCHL